MLSGMERASRPTGKLMTRVYRDFVRELNALWETSRAIATYLPQARLLLRQGQLSPLELGSFVEPPNSRNRGPETFGILQRAESSFPARALVAAVSTFEVHLGSIAKLTYLNTDPSTVMAFEDASDARIKKVVSWVFDSSDQEELIERILDDKIRSVLSDGIVEVLVKDRLKLGLGRHFQTGHGEVLDRYREIRHDGMSSSIRAAGQTTHTARGMMAPESASG